jgi:carbon-monoxide dehydrogenase medium subunit
MMPLLARRELRVSAVVDLNRVAELAFVTREDSVLRVGALTRLRPLETAPVVRRAVPLLARASALSGPVQVRNRATLGGALAHADPAGEHPAVAVALGARIELCGEHVRHVPAEQFFFDAHRTALGNQEVLAAVEYPVSPEPAAFAIEEVAPRSVDRALAGVVVGSPTGKLVLFGVGSTPVRSVAAEAALARGDTPDEVAEAAVAGLDPPDGGELSGASRRTLVRAAVVRAVASIRKQAT